MWEVSTVNMEGRQHVGASAQFYRADERISKRACLVQTPTLPGLMSREITNTLLCLPLFARVALCCL